MRPVSQRRKAEAHQGDPCGTSDWPTGPWQGGSSPTPSAAHTPARVPNTPTQGTWPCHPSSHTGLTGAGNHLTTDMSRPLALPQSHRCHPLGHLPPSPLCWPPSCAGHPPVSPKPQGAPTPRREWAGGCGTEAPPGSSLYFKWLLAETWPMLSLSPKRSSPAGDSGPVWVGLQGRVGASTSPQAFGSSQLPWDR